MKTKILGLLAVVLLVGPMSVRASAVNGLTISGVNILGTTYDVTFVDGTYDGAYSSIPPTFLTGNSTAAAAAASAILSSGQWTSPQDSNFWGFIIPYAVASTNFAACVAGGTLGSRCDAFGVTTIDLSANWSFTRFTAAAVPEPGTLALLGLGLAGLGLSR